ncbi:hypothetical protein, conserved [Babesia bigemina]|nr:hypothetical protein, conserved [Babesia bigemina]CDR71508.1 hypothetical protein, conserved [Babesia bigemina]|eukprot:XP_012770454.1 hypothetical protein, conserved [Babesia bigemina]
MKKLKPSVINSPSSPSPSAESDKLHSKLQALEKVEKLCENYEKLKTSDNNPKNLLDNLCDGLETFLGFNSASKGYDGTGIVYSDLDRLCDGVMGFLSGVLGAVKNENEVTTYDNYITSTNINSVVSKIHDCIGKGPEAFKEAMADVIFWLRKYNFVLQEKTSELTAEISKFMNSKIGYDYIKRVSGSSTKSLREQLSDWTNVVGEIQRDLTKIETENINALDKTLRNNIMHKFEPVKTSVQLLLESAQNDALVKQATKVDAELEKQEKEIKKEILRQSISITDTFKEGFQEVFRNIRHLSDVEKTQFGSIKNRLEEAQKFLNTKFDYEYKSHVIGKFEDIKTVVKNVHAMLSVQKQGLEKLVAYAWQHFEQLKINTIKKEPGNGEDNSIGKKWEELQTQIISIVGDINGTGAGHNKNHPSHDGLEGIQTRTKEWAEGFTHFENVVEKWVAEILNDGKGMVIDKVNKYYGNITENDKTAISRVFKEQLNAKVIKTNGPLTVRVMEGRDSIQQNINAVQSSCDKFAKVLHEKIKAHDTLVDIAKSILEAINLQVKTTTKTNDARDISDAIRSTLEQLVGMSRSASLEIKSVTAENSTYSLGKRVDEALKEIDNIRKEFVAGGEGRNGKFITAALITVNDKIRLLEPILKNEATGSLRATANAVETIVTELQEFTKTKNTNGSIEQKKQAVVDKMADLKSQIQSHISVILKAVVDADAYLEAVINDIQDALTEADIKANQAVNQLKEELTEKVDKAFHIINIEVKSLFAKERTAHLSALKTLVTRQLKIITCTVNKNLNTGLKGFLKTLSGDYVDIYLAGYKERPKHLPPKAQKTNPLDEVKTALERGEHGDKVATLSSTFKHYSEHIFDYLDKDLKHNFASQPQVIGQYDQTVSTIRSNLTDLLTHISAHKHFDHQVPEMLETLKTSLTSFKSSHFGNASYPVLDAFPRSLEQFVGELERMYVSRYDGHKQKVNMGKLVISDGDKGEKLTDDGRNLSKVFLTILVTLKAGLDELKQNAPNAWRGRQIYLQDSNEDENSFGQFLNKCGYKVSKSHDSHEGHLRNKEQCKGQYIHDGLLVGDKQHIYHSDKNGKRALEILFDYLETYNDLCHLSTLTSKRQPCSVYEMLAWLSGLTHNPVHQSKLSVAIMNVLEELYKRGREDEGEHGDVLAVERQADGGEFKVSLVDARSVSLEAYPRDVSYDELWAAVTHICSTSYDVLCAIAGHGDEFTTYAVDYSNNHMKFNYPQNGEDCLDMLLDILRRMLPTLQYLYSQCRLSNGLNGWQACKYGKDIMTAKWPCKVHPSDEPDNKSNCQAKCKPTCQAKCEVTCQVDCQPTSPLMSYLNDCLPGHLPHQLTKIGCKYECSNCSTSKKGKPCLTPLGFKGFSGSTRMGKDICEVLTKFINIKHLTGLFTLIPKPPSTLPEHFGFTLALAIGINATSRTNNYDPHAFRGVFAASIYEQTINLCTDQSTLTNALTDAYGSPSPTHGVCEHAHVRNLTASDSCKGKTNLELECAPYLANLSVDCYRYLGKKHSNLYLSWAVYLPWSFWTNLKNLYDAFCNIYCQDWGCRGCLRGDKCKRGEHGSISDASKQPNCQCHSIVDCRGVAPTLYSYGFSFGDPSKLQNEHYPNTCADFRKQLKNVLKSEYFTKLFEECDKFLFTIREPFIWLNVALWLLSFLYLLHIMVIRLDLLHIKSHLHSPSSHRIATQSLLAAARVKALNKVLYLQP